MSASAWSMSRRHRRLARAEEIPGAGLTHSSRRRPWRPLAALAAAMPAVIFQQAACGERGPAGAEDLYAEMERELDRARERARAADPAGARRKFFDAAHDPLHRLAAEVAERNRPRAARVLEAKQAVERSLAEGGPTLAEDLDRLLAAVADARADGAGRDPPATEGKR